MTVEPESCPRCGEQDWHVWQEAERPSRGLPREQFAAWHFRFEQDLRSRVAHWRRRSLLVDGTETQFDWLTDGDHWIAFATLGAYLVIVQGRDVPLEEVELRRIENVDSYIEGHRSGRL